MNDIKFGIEYLKELEAESKASRKCLERIPDNLFGWKPHEKSMNMGYLALLVAEIPLWIAHIVEKSEIDFVTFQHIKVESTQQLVEHHEANMEAARRALKNVTNDELEEAFYLKNNGEVLFTSSKKLNVSTSINHLVHHRGQLTVYMRLNDIAVPSIYGPSADEKSF